MAWHGMAWHTWRDGAAVHSRHRVRAGPRDSPGGRRSCCAGRRRGAGWPGGPPYPAPPDIAPSGSPPSRVRRSDWPARAVPGSCRPRPPPRSPLVRPHPAARARPANVDRTESIDRAQTVAGAQLCHRHRTPPFLLSFSPPPKGNLSTTMPARTALSCRARVRGGAVCKSDSAHSKQASRAEQAEQSAVRSFPSRGRRRGSSGAGHCRAWAWAPSPSTTRSQRPTQRREKEIRRAAGGI